MPYRYANRPVNENYYVVEGVNPDYYTEKEIVEMSSIAGATYVKRLTLVCAFAIAIGGVMMLAIERKD